MFTDYLEKYIVHCTDAAALQEVKYWLQVREEEASRENRPAYIIVGNKLDLHEARVVAIEEAEVRFRYCFSCHLS